MSRNMLIVVVVSLALALTVNVTHAEKRGLFGIGVGTVSGIGSPVGDGNTTSQLFSINGFGMLAMNQWLALVADFTIGLPRTYEGAISGGETQKVELSSFFFDAMAGAYKTYAEGGYLYLGAGLAIASGNREDTLADTGSLELFKSDPGTSLGFTFGAGLGIPVSNKMFAFMSLRQRFVTANVETTGVGYRATQDVSIGGFDMAAGVAFGFGL